MARYPCDRCLGKGTIRGFSHVLGGTCFKCHGIGTVETKPTTPTPKWRVHLPSTIGGDPGGYNVNAKTPNAAIKRASVIFSRASPAYRREHTLEGAWVEPYADFERRWFKEHE